MVLTRQPFEELPHTGQIMVLAGRAQRLTARLAIGVEMLLVTLQDRLGHVLRTCEATFITPAGEAPEIALATMAVRGL